MKIAQVVCVYPPYKGGIGTSAQTLTRILSSAHHKVDTFTIDYGNGTKEDGLIRLRAIPRLGNGGLVPQLFWRLKDFDLVYLHYPFFGATEIIWFLKKFFWKNKIKLIVHFHMEPEFSSPFLKILSWPSRLIAPLLFASADSIICASSDYAEANLPKRIWSANKNKIVEIPFGVDTEKFKPANPPEEALPYFAATESRDDTFKILFVGALDKAHYFKGIDVLLEALNLLDKDKEGWQAEIVGGGNLQSQDETRARDLGIADKVIFVGKVSDEELSEKYQQADCLVLPSINRGEAFGIVLLEAMSSGIPVIASDLPGVRKVFTDGEEGLLVRPGSAADLKEKIKYLLENTARGGKMGAAARRLVEEKYSLEKVSGKLINVLVNKTIR